MKKMLALDLDSVLADIMNPLIEFHNKNYGTKNALKEHTNFDLTVTWSCSKEEVLKRVYEFYFSDEFLRLKPLKGAQNAAKYLAKKYKLAVITSRPHIVTERTDNWVNEHFSDLISDIVHTNQFSADHEVKITKSKVCKRIGADTIIEDAIHFATECAENGIKVYLIDQPWNKEVSLHKNITRFHSWSDIKSFL